MQKRKCLLSTALAAIMVCAFVGCGSSEATKQEYGNQNLANAEAVETVVEVGAATNTNSDPNSEEYLNNGLTKEAYYEKYGTLEGFITPIGIYHEVELDKSVKLENLKEPLEGVKEYVGEDGDGKVALTKGFDVYNLDKEKVGYYNEDCAVVIKSYNEEWCVIGCFNFDFLAKTKEVNDALTKFEVKLIEEEPAPSLAENNTSTENKTEEKSQADIEKEAALAYWEDYEIIPLEKGYQVTENGVTKKLGFHFPSRAWWEDAPIYDTFEEDRQVIGTLKKDGLVSTVEFVSTLEAVFWGIEYNDSVAYIEFGLIDHYGRVLDVPVTNRGEVYVASNTTEAEPSNKEPEAIPNEPVVSEPTPEVVPETPAITEEPVVEEAKTESKPTPDEVLAFIHETLQGAGIRYYPDVYPDCPGGPSGGMGWSEGADDPNWLMENPDQILAPYQVFGYTLYYIEYLGEDEFGEYIFRWYWGGAQ